MKVKADLHNHLQSSSRQWKEGDFDRLADITRERLGEGGIVGLVNFSDNRYERMIRQGGYARDYVDGRATYVPSKDVLIVKGQEVPTKQGHLLVLGLPKNVYLKDGREVRDSIKEAADLGGVIGADHVYGKGGLGKYLEENPGDIALFDFFETHNAEANLWIPLVNDFNANKRARDFYQEIKGIYPNLGELSTSDGHSWYEVGKCWTAIEKPELNRFSESLKHSVINTRKGTEHQRKSSKLAALNHAFDIVAVKAIEKIPGARDFVLGKGYPWFEKQ